MGLLPKLNPQRLSRAFVRNVAARRVREFLEELGAERVQWIVENRRQLSTLITPPQEAHYRKLGRGFGWVSQAISDEDFEKMLPEWAGDILTSSGEEGRAWFKGELRWLRGFLTGGSDGNRT